MLRRAIVLVCLHAAVSTGCGSRTDDQGGKPELSKTAGQPPASDAQEPAASEGPKAPEVDLWTAAAAGDLEAVKQHLAAGSDVNKKESVGQGTPLVMAAFAGQTEVAELLIENGGSLTVKNHDGSTPLHVAAFFAHPQTVEMLLKRGADSQATNDKGQTALDLVEGPWGPFLATYYRLAGTALGVELDLERIKTNRPKVAEILRRAEDAKN